MCGGFGSDDSVSSTLDAYTDSVRGFRRNVMEEPVDGSTPTFPADISFTVPTLVPRGIWERVIEYANRIKASAGYVVGIGESYGIVPSLPGPPSPDSVPAIELSAAVHGYLFSVVGTGREDADAWQVWLRPSTSSGAYQNAATATGKSVDVTYSPGGGDPGPVVLQVYVQLRKDNANYGDPSDIVLVTVNP